MATALGSRDVERALALAGEAAEAESLADFRACVLERLPDLVPSDITSYNEIGADGEFVLAMDPMDAWTRERERDFLRLAHEHPLIAHYRATGDPGPWKISDLLSRGAFRRTELYRSVYAPMGVEYQMAVTLPAAADAVVAIALNRDRRDFDERDRAMLSAIRPHLARLRDAAAARERDRALASLLERVADAEGRGVVILGRDGSVAFASPGRGSSWRPTCRRRPRPACCRRRSPTGSACGAVRGSSRPPPSSATGPPGAATARALGALPAV